MSRNEEAEMRLWAKRFGKCVRQRNVRQDNTMDRAGTLPLNLYETQTSLDPLDLQFVFPHAQSSVPDESPESETDEHPVEVITCTDQRDDYSSSESGDSESDENWLQDGYVNKGWKRKSVHQQNERFSSVQVKVRVCA